MNVVVQQISTAFMVITLRKNIPMDPSVLSVFMSHRLVKFCHCVGMMNWLIHPLPLMNLAIKLTAIKRYG